MNSPDELARKIAAVGLKLIRNAEWADEHCSSLCPLGMALVEWASLVSMLTCPADDQSMFQLLDGGESQGPNLDTRLRCIRDLCSASVYAIRKRIIPHSLDNFTADTPFVATPGGHYWANLVTKGGARCDAMALLELGRLIDDLYEEMVVITILLEQDNSKPQPTWDEIYRAATHIRDHYDYAEEAVITCIRSGDDPVQSP